MGREFERDPARLTNAIADTIGEHDVVAVIGEKSLSVCAMLMIGRPERTSSR